MTHRMSLRSLSNRFAHAALAALPALLLGLPGISGAVPVNGAYVDDARCDAIPNQTFSHEIGENSFPLNELIQVFVGPAPTTRCVGDDGVMNDFVVQIINLSPIAYVDLFFVADDGILIGNADGMAEDLINAPGIFADAFKIDGTVTITGINDTLMGESATVNEIFEPGESWRFIVTNVIFPASVPPTLIFDSVGGFAGGSLGYPPSTASIVGTPIPEPSTALLVGLGLTALARMRRSGARRGAAC
jgi:hypothetical protein